MFIISFLHLSAFVIFSADAYAYHICDPDFAHGWELQPDADELLGLPFSGQLIANEVFRFEFAVNQGFLDHLEYYHCQKSPAAPVRTYISHSPDFVRHFYRCYESFNEEDCSLVCDFYVLPPML